jgi:hypothetical protein
MEQAETGISESEFRQKATALFGEAKAPEQKVEADHSIKLPHEIEEEPSTETQPEQQEQPESAEKQELPEELKPYEKYKDFAVFAKEIHESGDLSADSIKKATEMLHSGAYSKETIETLVNDYLDLGKKAVGLSKEKTQAELTAFGNQIKESVGGAESFNKMLEWAKGSLSSSEQDAYNNMVNRGGDEARLAVEALNARYVKANNIVQKPKLLTSIATQKQDGGFRSREDIQKALSDPRFERDPKYRALVMEKAKGFRG